MNPKRNILRIFPKRNPEITRGRMPKGATGGIPEESIGVIHGETS